ncbi:MAG: hypothetical protein ACRCUB_07650, partial [Plesiomonas shigelloides]
TATATKQLPSVAPSRSPFRQGATSLGSGINILLFNHLQSYQPPQHRKRLPRKLPFHPSVAFKSLK